MNRRIAILGAGIAGLTAAYRLVQQGVGVTVFEARDRVGGVIQTLRAHGFLAEMGPNSFRTSTPLLETLIDELGLAGEIVEANPAARHRYVVRDGTLRALPTAPPGVLSTSAFSVGGKLRLLREPFIRPADSEAEESVADFVRRRFGEDVLRYAVDPFVGGIFAGDPERLSLPHAFPALYQLERQHGSVLRGMIRQQRQRGSSDEESERYGLFSFRNGMSVLPESLGARLQTSLRLATRVSGLQPVLNGWRVLLEGGGSEDFGGVLSTLPLHQLRNVEFSIGEDVQSLEAVEYPPIAVVALGFRKEDVAHDLAGFGVLVPGAEKTFTVLGVIFSSTVFPGRAPDDCVLLTVLLGRALRSELVAAEPRMIIDTALSDLRALVGIQGAPVFSHLHRWEHAIPQYNLGYGDVKARIGRLEASNPGLWLAGNYRQGISLLDTMASAEEAVQRILAYAPMRADSARER